MVIVVIQSKAIGGRGRMAPPPIRTARHLDMARVLGPDAVDDACTRLPD